MSETNVVFSSEGVNLIIKCPIEDKMKEICQKYSTKINKNINSLLFLHEEKQVNFELSFKELANSSDRNNNKMIIMVNYKKNEKILNNINSIYITKILFSHLDEIIKLKLIKYNKKLQNKIDVKLINYKFYNRKYIIYETKVKGKEYDGENDTLYFEWEYLNGERNGKGKEYYYNGNIIFEGEYLNGERLSGKAYDNEGNLCYDLKNANGIIKEYDIMVN